MTSRMDRYNQNKSSSKERSLKNKSLYEQIQNLDSYTNIEGVATIEKTNEIDLLQVEELLKNRENYKKQKKYKEILNKEEPIIKKEEEIISDNEIYDINDMLSKIKNDDDNNENYRKLDDNQIETLKSLSNKSKKLDIEEEENEIKELINTIYENTKLNKLSKTSTDIGLFDNLKSDTMVGNASSIKKIIEDEKNTKTSLDDDTMEIDKSFYTSSLGFTSNDLEELKDINHKIKKGNKFIIILLIVVIILIILAVIFFILKNK